MIKNILIFMLSITSSVYCMAPSASATPADNKRKAELEMAIDKEDTERIYTLKKAATEQELEEAAFYAGTSNKPHSLIALLPKMRCSQSQGLTLLFENGIPDATPREVDCYYAALEILKKKEITRIQAYTKISLNNNTQNLLKKDEKSHNEKSLHIPPEIHDTIQQMLAAHHIHEPTKMSPILEDAIIRGSLTQLSNALNHGASVHLPNERNDMNVFELAVYWGKRDILEYLIHNSPYIPESLQKKLIELAAKRLQEVRFIPDKDSKYREEYIANLHATQHYLISHEEKSLHHYTQTMNMKLIANSRNTAIAIKSLNHGANPNLLLDNGNPIIWLALVDNNPSLMKILCKSSANCNAKIALANNQYTTPLLYTIRTNQYENFMILLEHGANTEDRDSQGINPLYASLEQDPKYIRALLAKKANPNTKIRSLAGNLVSMLQCAITKGAHEHTQALREYGARKKKITEENA